MAEELANLIFNQESLMCLDEAAMQSIKKYISKKKSEFYNTKRDKLRETMREHEQRILRVQ